jgi:hypothetical protein
LRYPDLSAELVGEEDASSTERSRALVLATLRSSADKHLDAIEAL